ncbi:MAG: phosphoribosylglycinamide formyltransferase [Clostridiales bacterium]|nr:phosphoribosylglycinamide formyltransferase [Clostridiales bacterium]
MNVAVLVSGGGTNLQALLDSKILKSGQIKLVISNNADAYALKRAENAGIPAVCVTKKSYKTAETCEAKMLEILQDYQIDVIVLAGFLSILSKDFIKSYENRIINIHPSLIPSFCGKGCYGIKVHEKALEKGVKITGATVHFVNEIADDGKIIMQKSVQVEDGDTPQTLQKRVMEEAEWKILPASLEWLCEKLLNENKEK